MDLPIACFGVHDAAVVHVAKTYIAKRPTLHTLLDNGGRGKGYIVLFWWQDKNPIDKINTTSIPLCL